MYVLNRLYTMQLAYAILRYIFKIIWNSYWNAKVQTTSEFLACFYFCIINVVLGCSWTTPTSQFNVMQCGDGTTCHGIKDGWGCCRNNKGRAKCPKNLPVMCSTKRCARGTQYCCELSCDAYGGPRPCSKKKAFSGKFY